MPVPTLPSVTLQKLETGACAEARLSLTQASHVRWSPTCYLSYREACTQCLNPSVSCEWISRKTIHTSTRSKMADNPVIPTRPGSGTLYSSILHIQYDISHENWPHIDGSIAT